MRLTIMPGIVVLTGIGPFARAECYVECRMGLIAETVEEMDDSRMNRKVPAEDSRENAPNHCAGFRAERE